MQTQMTTTQQDPQPAEGLALPAPQELSLEQAAAVAGGPGSKNTGQ